jgi:hypothetical protein
MAVPASAAKADMYAASIGLAWWGISYRSYNELTAAPITGIRRTLGGCEVTIARPDRLDNNKSRFRCVADDRAD